MVHVVSLAPLEKLFQQQLREKMEDHPLRAFGRKGALAGPGGLAGKHLLLRGLALQDFFKRGPFDWRHVHQLLRQTWVRQQE